MAAVTDDAIERRAIELASSPGPSPGRASFDQAAPDHASPDQASADHASPDQASAGATFADRGSPDRAGAVAELLALAGGDHRALETARYRVAQRLHDNAGDYTATAALTLLNQALSTMGRVDPFDWKVRWTQRFKRP